MKWPSDLGLKISSIAWPKEEIANLVERKPKL
jgi:predicted DNA-binding transcriptional regulator AlpA